jgi:hypothetical protein
VEFLQLEKLFGQFESTGIHTKFRHSVCGAEYRMRVDCGFSRSCFCDLEGKSSRKL